MNKELLILFNRMRNWEAWTATFLIIICSILSVFLFPHEALSSYGSIFGAAGSFVAIIWFYSSLQLQSVQLEEQRKQFQLEFNHLRQEAKRNAILFAREILNDMERQVSEYQT